MTRSGKLSPRPLPGGPADATHRPFFPVSTPRAPLTRPIRRKAFMTDATIPRAGLLPLPPGQPDPAARPDDADMGGTFGRRAAVGRRDRSDDPNLHALGAGAGSDPRRRAFFAASRLAAPARPLALSRGHGRRPATPSSSPSSMSPRIAPARSTFRSSRARFPRSSCSARGLSSASGSPRCRRSAPSSPCSASS